MARPYSTEEIRDISVGVYKRRLIQDKGSPDRMISDDGDGGIKFRARAASYDPLTRCYLKELGLMESKKKDVNL